MKAKPMDRGSLIGRIYGSHIQRFKSESKIIHTIFKSKFINFDSSSGDESVHESEDNGHLENENLKIPIDYIFPDDVHQLCSDVKALKEENSCLKAKLQEAKDKIQLLNADLEVTRKCKSVENRQHYATNKIIELNKKNRELTLELEVLKTERNQLNKVQKESVDESSLNLISCTGETYDKIGNDKTEIDSRSTKKQIDSLQVQLFRFRSICDRLRNDLKIAYQIIEKEVGRDAESVIKHFQENESTWVGRTEEITVLNEKITELKEKLAQRKTTFMNNRNMIEALKLNEKESKMKAQKEIQQLKDQIEDLKKSHNGAKARQRVLETEIKNEKNKHKILLEKSETDDKIIEVLNRKLATHAEENNNKKVRRDDLQTKVETLEAKLEQTNTKCEMLTLAVENKDNIIKQLKERLSLESKNVYSNIGCVESHSQEESDKEFEQLLEETKQILNNENGIRPTLTID